MSSNFQNEKQIFQNMVLTGNNDNPGLKLCLFFSVCPSRSMVEKSYMKHLHNTHIVPWNGNWQSLAIQLKCVVICSHVTSRL